MSEQTPERIERNVEDEEDLMMYPASEQQARQEYDRLFGLLDRVAELEQLVRQLQREVAALKRIQR
jgi:DNA topoisomerase IA